MQRYRLPLTREVPIPSDEEAALPQPIAYYYLASEVDARIAELEQLFEARVKDLQEKLAEEKKMGAALCTSNQRLRQKIDRLSR